MGVRLHYAEKYEVRYSQAGFCNYLLPEINSFLYDLCGGFSSCNGEDYYYSDEFEIDKGSIEDAIEELNDMDNSNLPTAVADAGYTIADIRNMLIEAVNNSDPNNDYVVFAWF